MNSDFDRYYEAAEPGRRERAYAWATAIGLQDVGMNDVINRRDDVINDAINFSEAEKVAIKAILRDPKLSAARLADILGVKQRQAQRIVASLKKKTNLTRCGARKNGEWRFGSGGMSSGSSSSGDSRISGAARTSSPEKGNLIE